MNDDIPGLDLRVSEVAPDHQAAIAEKLKWHTTDETTNSENKEGAGSMGENSVGRHFGPMYGERSRRHQKTVTGSQREGINQIIVTMYELHEREQPQVGVELTHGLGIGAYARADLTLTEAAALRDWLDEFIKSYTSLEGT